MKIGITGASGFVGRRLVEIAHAKRHSIVGYSRKARQPTPYVPEWRVMTPDASPDVSGLDVVVHLAGESVLGRWTPEKKDEIYRSRVDSTRRIVEAIAREKDPPKTFICGSAIGYYGDTGEREVSETDPPGAGFLAGVATAWEQEAIKAEALGTRVVRVRTGFVIGQGGAAMGLVLPIFKAGLGGKLGNGRQWMSCVHIDDVVGIILHLATRENLSGAFNAVMPRPVRNAAFTGELASILHRPAILPVPAFALRAMLGEMASLLLDSQRVLPVRTLESGYACKFPQVGAALHDACGD